MLDLNRRKLLLSTGSFALGFSIFSSNAATAAPIDITIENLIKKMSIEEKAGQLSLFADYSRPLGTDINPNAVKSSLDNFKEEIRKGRMTGTFNGLGVAAGRELQKTAIEQSPSKIPLIFAGDIIHGMTTIFPIPMGEAASFDPLLAKRTARAGAIEGTARGFHWTFSPMVDIARDQRWGRVSEGAGEDPYLGQLFASARVEGFNGSNIRAEDSMIACLKHFAAYGAVEGGMEYNTSDIPETTLRETHLPPFKSGIDTGALTIMSSFNDIAGVPATGNRHLLTDILRGEWGFKGFVVSDYTSEEELIAHGFAKDGRDATKKAFLAGCDMSMQSGLYNKHLPDLVRSGEVSMAALDQSVRRVLMVKKAIGLFDNPYRSLSVEKEKSKIRLSETIALSREAARRSCVLLKNEGNILPLKKSGQKIALIGPLANDQRNMNGSWVIAPDTANIVTIEQGIRAQISNASDLIVAKGSEIETYIDGGINAAREAAKNAEIIVLCIGEGEFMSGEAQSRTEIIIPKPQQELAEALAKLNKPMIILLSNGRALALEGAVKDAGAILVTWFLGSEAGNGIADLLFGDYSPEGRLPVSFPQRSGQQPFYYNHRPTGRPQTNPSDPSYKSRYREVTFAPLYPFGHGLSYSKIEYGVPTLSKSSIGWNETASISTQITNTGKRATREVAQLYIYDRVASITQPVRKLKGIKQVDLEPGETKIVNFTLRKGDLAFVQQNLKKEAEAGEFDIWVAPNSSAGTAVKLTLIR